MISFRNVSIALALLAVGVFCGWYFLAGSSQTKVAGKAPDSVQETVGEQQQDSADTRTSIQMWNQAIHSHPPVEGAIGWKPKEVRRVTHGSGCRKGDQRINPITKELEVCSPNS